MGSFYPIVVQIKMSTGPKRRFLNNTDVKVRSRHFTEKSQKGGDGPTSRSESTGCRGTPRGPVTDCNPNREFGVVRNPFIYLNKIISMNRLFVNNSIMVRKGLSR